MVGPSGAGKSTVLRLLAGLQLPSSGELRLFDKPQTYLRLDQTDPTDVRLVFQNPALLASLTVEQNVGFLLRKKRKLSRAEIRERVDACLEAVGLFDVAHLYPGELSGGMQKRVSFARALIDNPQRADESMPLMLYDEPTAGLDPMACTLIEDLIMKTTTVAEGCSVVVSHVRSTIERSAERVVMLYGGAFSGRDRWRSSAARTTPMSSSSGRVACADQCSTRTDSDATQCSRRNCWLHRDRWHRRLCRYGDVDAGHPAGSGQPLDGDGIVQRCRRFGGALTGDLSGHPCGLCAVCEGHS